MLLFVNATTLVKGGALQVASTLYRELGSMGLVECQWIVSPQLNAELMTTVQGNSPRRPPIVLPESPARSLAARTRLIQLETSLRPKAVLTVFGPAYVNFRAPHLMGVADGWVTHATGQTYKCLPTWQERLRMRALVAYKTYWYKKASKWVVEAEVARQGAAARFGAALDDIVVIPNGCSPSFLRFVGTRREFPVGRKRILCMSAYYPHKQLESVPIVAKHLRAFAPDERFEFVLTLPERDPATLKIMSLALNLGVRDMVTNIGPVPVGDVANVYQTCDILFLPSAIETFSSNYPEAMAMGLPIVTTDYFFSRDVCRDAASYFADGDWEGAARAVLDVTSGREQWEAAQTRGYDRVRQFERPEARSLLYEKTVLELLRFGHLAR
jgi:glycosyltransferase involved in cell wall biosynthesis